MAAIERFVTAGLIAVVAAFAGILAFVGDTRSFLGLEEVGQREAVGRDLSRQGGRRRSLFEDFAVGLGRRGRLWV